MVKIKGWTKIVDTKTRIRFRSNKGNRISIDDISKNKVSLKKWFVRITDGDKVSIRVFSSSRNEPLNYVKNYMKKHPKG